MGASEEQKVDRRAVDVLPWLIKAGNDGILTDSIVVCVMDGSELVSVSLHKAAKPLSASA